jgi:hypothetical protein
MQKSTLTSFYAVKHLYLGFEARTLCSLRGRTLVCPYQGAFEAMLLCRTRLGYLFEGAKVPALLADQWVSSSKETIEWQKARL